MTRKPTSIPNDSWARPVLTFGFAIAASVSACLVAADDRPAPLFDGLTLTGWTTLDGEPVTRGWEVVDGMIHLPPSSGRAGHIVTAREIGDFVLSFDFKIAQGGNSGLKYRVKDFDGRVLGCEYQIYDDAHPEHPVDPKNSTGSLYDVYEPAADKLLHPAGEFNTALVIVRGNVIEHWLNGRLLLRAVVGSPEWDRRIAASKFHDDPGFGENRFGKLMLTDHGSEVWYGNFEFIELPTEPAPAPLASSPPHPLAGPEARLTTDAVASVPCCSPCCSLDVPSRKPRASWERRSRSGRICRRRR